MKIRRKIPPRVTPTRRPLPDRGPPRAYGRHWAPAVFQYCKGMIEALPGWPKEIFSGMLDRSKAEHLDRLVLAAKHYLDHGRHVAQGGAQEGDFPVNHREALFALNMAKVLLAEISATMGSS